MEREGNGRERGRTGRLPGCYGASQHVRDETGGNVGGWLIECDNEECGAGTWAAEFDDLMNNHRHDNRRFRCAQCGGCGRIRKEHRKMEGRNEAAWRPQLVGAIQPDWCDVDPDGLYQPFAFVTEEKNGPGVWMRYYKDTRGEPGGSLKSGDRFVLAA